MKVAEGQTSKLDTASPYGRRHTRQVLWFHGLYTLKKAVRIVQENPELILILQCSAGTMILSVANRSTQAFEGARLDYIIQANVAFPLIQVVPDPGSCFDLMTTQIGQRGL